MPANLDAGRVVGGGITIFREATLIDWRDMGCQELFLSLWVLLSWMVGQLISIHLDLLEASAKKNER